MNHPGPWKDCGDESGSIRDANGHRVAQVDDPETRRLILAAPELRDLLQRLEDCIEIGEVPELIKEVESLLHRIEEG